MHIPLVPSICRVTLIMALAILAAPTARAAASNDAAQRQLREDRERFQREVERQKTDAKIRDDQARIAAEQQRTADELERLRARQSRQASETSRLTGSTRTLTPAPVAGTPSLTSGEPSTLVSYVPVRIESGATITPDFSVSFLPDGTCVVYIRGKAAKVLSPDEAEKTFRALLDEKSKNAVGPALTP